MRFAAKIVRHFRCGSMNLINRENRRYFGLAACVVYLAVSHGAAFGSISLALPTYSENFDGKLTATAANASVATWSTTVGVQSPVPGTSGWDGVKLAGSSTTTLMPYITSIGTSLTGGIYNFGAASAVDRALGTLGSGANAPGIGVELVNNTGALIDQVTISYTGEFWRGSTSVQNVLTFGYFLTGVTSTNYLSAGGASSVAALDLLGPAPVTSNGPLDGNTNNAPFAATFSVAWPIGSSLFLRWQDVDNTGFDAGLAIDSFSLTGRQVVVVAAVPEASTIFVWATLCGSVLVGWRRCLQVT